MASSPAASTSETAARGSGRMRHVLSALVQNQPGVLAHVSGMFASRGFNIDSLAVGETEDPHLSRITVVVMGDDSDLEQVRKQLEKIVTVVKVVDISREDFVERDLMLIKVDAPPERPRAELQALVEIYRGRIVDIGPEQMMIEISGKESKLEAFVEAIRPYGIRELARTGRIALVRNSHVSRPDLDSGVEERGAVVPRAFEPLRRPGSTDTTAQPPPYPPPQGRRVSSSPALSGNSLPLVGGGRVGVYRVGPNGITLTESLT